MVKSKKKSSGGSMAKGGGIKHFLYRDIEEPSSEQKMTKKQVQKYIAEWNESMGTNYKDYKQFNKGEEYYEILPIKEKKEDGGSMASG